MRLRSNPNIKSEAYITMRYPILNLIACPYSKSPLVCVAVKEYQAPLPHVKMSECARVNSTLGVGPLPENAPRNELVSMLSRYACVAAPSLRAYDVRVEQGILIAPDSGRWYPVRDFVPELLPDHLRNRGNDTAFLHSLSHALPPDLFKFLENGLRTDPPSQVEDKGIHYKSAEMTITDRVRDPEFFGPGYVAPFNPGAPERTSCLIRLFGVCTILLETTQRRVILDAGCGYSWTTEWLWKCGMEPLGLDIARAYIDIARARLGDNLPYVVAGDTENLPVQKGVFDAVLGFDAFHHIPNRNRAMCEFAGALRKGGKVVLAEPDASHEKTEQSQRVMQTHGILEKGMDYEDVVGYVNGSGLERPVQHFFRHKEGHRFQSHFLQGDSIVPWNLFTIRK